MTYETANLTEHELAALANARPRTDDQLHLWVELVLGLRMPREPICTDHGHVAPFDYLRDAFFERFTDAVIWANRGGGKTMLGAMVTLLDSRFKAGTAVRILGGSLEQSQKMYRYLRQMVQRHFLDKLAGGEDGGHGGGRVGRAGIGARTIRFANGSEVEILAQSERSVRGNRVQKMRCDEIELFDSDVWTSCQLVTESREEFRISDCGLRNDGDGPDVFNPKSEIRHPKLIRGAVEAFSTFHRVGGLMQHVVEQARTRGSPVYRWCVLDVLERCPEWRSCPACPLADECAGRARHAAGFLRIDDAIAAKARVSRETWESEMLCLRPSRRGAVFPTFDRARHVGAVRCQAGWPTYRAIDFGFVNPFVCLWVQVSPTEGLRGGGN